VARLSVAFAFVSAGAWVAGATAVGGGAHAATAGTAAAAEGREASTTPSLSTFASVLADDLDVVLFPATRRPPPRPLVTVATRVRAEPAAVGAVLLDPARYRAALPSLVRAEVVAVRPALGRAANDGYGPERLLAWELEIPLFNLKGRAWLSRQGDAVELTLVDGAFAPGHVSFRLAPLPGGQATVLASEVQVDAQSANWIIRRIARHDPWAETAMTAAAAWVLTRAVAVEAQTSGRSAPSRPSSPIVVPAVTALDGAALASDAFAPLRRAGVVAAVRRTPTGRLNWVSAAAMISAPPPVVAAELATPETWTAFPGWKSVKRLPAEQAEGLRIEVQDNVAFVDLDGVWRVTYGGAARASAIAGATRGAVFAWQTYPAPGGALAVLSMHPRLDASGYVARKMIAVEPLLEHGLALGLTYAAAAALADRLTDIRQ